MVFLKYEPYVNYQKDARLTNVALLINSTSQNIDVTPEVDYVFQFSLVEYTRQLQRCKRFFFREPATEIQKKTKQYICLATNSGYVL